MQVCWLEILFEFLYKLFILLLFLKDVLVDYNWPLNNMSLKGMGSLIPRFFLKKYVLQYSMTQSVESMNLEP